MENKKIILDFARVHGINATANYGFLPVKQRILNNMFARPQIEFIEDDIDYDPKNFEEVPTMNIQPAIRDDYSPSEFHSNPVNKWFLVEMFEDDLNKIAKYFVFNVERLKRLVFDCLTLFKDIGEEGFFMFFFNHGLFKFISKDIDTNNIIRELEILFNAFCESYNKEIELINYNFKKFFLPRFAKYNKKL